MIQRLLFLTSLLITTSVAYSQQVPSRMEFADLELRLTDGAVRDIQASVDAMTRSETYFQKKLQRVDMYMPIIERIFAEEGLPDDFKYLVIQESALVSDAVSSSNAVGFWQFKEISGLENDLRIDRAVDERMNIVSASRAAAKYLKSHNSYFDNWAYALIAYQAGRGGAKSLIDENNFGKKRLTISSDSYWYLKKFLAHKIAFEGVLGTSDVPYFLSEKTDAAGMSLKEVAQSQGVPEALVEEYNKWLKKGRIPDDKIYAVIVPLAPSSKLTDAQARQTYKKPYEELPGEVDLSEQDKFPIIDGNYKNGNTTIAHEIKINGKKGIVAAQGYDVEKLAEAGGLSVKKFRKFNDMSLNQTIETDKIYYLKRKRNRAKFYYHTVQEGENMWQISQKYGLKLHKLYRKNRISEPTQPKAGRVLWLRLNRPADVPIEYKKVPENTKPIKSIATQHTDSQNTETTQDIKDKSVSTQNSLIQNDTLVNKIAASNPKLASPPIESNRTDNSLETDENAKSVNDIFINSSDNNLAESAQEKEAENQRQELMPYSIKKGDTFFAIANKFDMHITDLLAFNQLTIRDTLFIGQKIQVNKSDSENLNLEKSETKFEKKPDTVIAQNDEEIKHIVQPGETMYALAKKYQVSLKQLMDWNEKTDYSVSLGEILIIKKK